MAIETATQVGITLGELITVGVFIVSALWVLGKLNMRQFATSLDEKFKAGRVRIDTLETSINAKFTASDQRIDERFATIDNKLRTFDPLHGELARVDKDLIQIRLDVSERLGQYIKADALQRLDDKITRLFGEVFSKLDAKADKEECQRHHQ